MIGEEKLVIIIETMEEERQLFTILNQNLPQTTKNTILDIIEQFEEKRAIWFQLNRDWILNPIGKCTKNKF